MNLKTNKGFSLIEVMISFVILVVGLLAATTLIIRSAQVNVNAYEIEQVAILANTMVEKIRANPDGISVYQNLERPTATEGVTACTNNSNSCSVDERARTDKSNFQEHINLLTLKDVAWVVTNSTASTLTGVTGRLYQLRITWGPLEEGSTNVSSNSYYLNFIL